MTQEKINKWIKNGDKYINYSAILQNENEKGILVRDFKIILLGDNKNELFKSGLLIVTPDVLEKNEKAYITETFKIKDEYENIKTIKAIFKRHKQGFSCF